MQCRDVAMGALVAVMVSASCGGRFEPYGGGLGEGGATNATCTTDGTRLCGGVCGLAPDCPGGCLPIVGGDGSPSTYGVCFADLPDKGQTPCAVCDTGEGCVQRSPGAYACVPLMICASLLALGAGDVCWYGDKSPYDGRGIDIPTTCPDSTPPLHQDHAMCGGACGACDPTLGALTRCIGQGPSHPVGICATPSGPVVNTHDPSQYPRCTVTGDTSSAPCGGPYKCAIFPAPPAEATVAKDNGICILAQDCTGLAASLPGGLTCY